MHNACISKKTFPFASPWGCPRISSFHLNLPKHTKKTAWPPIFHSKTPLKTGFRPLKKIWRKAATPQLPPSKPGAGGHPTKLWFRECLDVVILPGVSRPWVLDGFWMGRWGFFRGPGDCPGTWLVRIHCWLDVKSCFFVEDLYFVGGGAWKEHILEQLWFWRSWRLVGFKECSSSMAGEYCMNTFKKNSQNERSSQTWDNKQIQSSTGWWSNLWIYCSFVALYHSAEVATSVTKIDPPCCQYPMTWMVDKTSRVRWHFPMTQVSSLSHPSRSPTFRDGVSFVFPRTWKLLTFDRSIYLPRGLLAFLERLPEWLESPETFSNLQSGIPWVYWRCGSIRSSASRPGWGNRLIDHPTSETMGVNPQRSSFCKIKNPRIDRHQPNICWGW